MAQRLATCATRAAPPLISIHNPSTIGSSAGFIKRMVSTAPFFHRTTRLKLTLLSHLASESTPRRHSTMAPIPSTGKAVQISKNGGVEVLEYRDVPVPKPAEGQVLIRNEFSGVNFIDTYFRTGLYPAPSFPLVLGREASGRVVAAHDSVKRGDLAPGARVVYMATGAYAQYTAVDAWQVVALPDALASDRAAAAYLQGLTAWLFVREAGEVKPGQWCLVHAAAGGVGLLLVQMLRAVGAKVIGTASSEEKQALARRHGAEWTIGSGDDVAGRVKEITGGHGVDVIFDGVGKDTFEADLEMIAVKGSLISFGNASGAVPPFNILRLGPKNIRLMRPVVNNYMTNKEDLQKYSRELFDLITSGKLEINIHEVYPLKDAARAHTDIESRKTTGKLLLKTD